MEEVRYFGRLAIYALLVGAAYWFLSYEPAGTVLLIGFGLATGAAFVVLRRGAPHEGAAAGAGTEASEAPFADESGPVPTRSGAPLAVGFGIAAMALAGAFGPWFLIAGAVPLILGAVDWLRAADRELALRSGADVPEPTGADGAEPAAASGLATQRGRETAMSAAADAAPRADAPSGR